MATGRCPRGPALPLQQVQPHAWVAPCSWTSLHCLAPAHWAGEGLSAAMAGCSDSITRAVPNPRGMPHTATCSRDTRTKVPLWLYLFFPQCNLRLQVSTE